jgi:DNA-binding CsgD family transcriptional regulator
VGLVDRVRRLCEASLSDRELRDRLIREIARTVAFDAHLLVVTDPVSGVVSSPHVTVPMVPPARLPDLIRHRYLVPAEDWPAWLTAEYGIGGTATVPLVDRYGTWGFLELWRTGTPFARAEHDALMGIAATLTRGLRQALARTFVAPGTGAGVAGSLLAEPVGGVILLGDDLRVRAETAAAARALLELLPPDEEIPPVPAIAFNVGAALLAAEAPGPARSTAPWTRAHLGGGRWVTAHAERADDDIVVSISPCSTGERVDLFARCHGFSPRELEVFDLVLRGHGSRRIAEALTIAPTTAEDHLRALLAKSRSASRQELVVRAVGASALPDDTSTGSLAGR